MPPDDLHDFSPADSSSHPNCDGCFLQRETAIHRESADPPSKAVIVCLEWRSLQDEGPVPRYCVAPALPVA